MPYRDFRQFLEVLRQHAHSSDCIQLQADASMEADG
jgi:hypothetical protein